MTRVLILGSTGSIGTQALELVRASGGCLRVAGLSALRSADELLAQVLEFRPAAAALVEPEAAARVRERWPADVRLYTGPEAVLELIASTEFDVALHGVVGAAGLRPSVEILRRGKTLALANKESLVVAGAELLELSRRHAAPILPVDSEHCAIFQCLSADSPVGAPPSAARVRRIYLTASGGALRDLPIAELAAVTPEQALRHPNWDMGRRITIGSATLMNKALEVIEAHHLFGLAPEQIEVVLHRQSIVHSLVEFIDGSVLAQLGPPDMRGPIHYALHWPARVAAPLQGFDFDLYRQLTFECADPERYPALQLGYECVRRGGTSGAVLNAADEVAVQSFLERRIGFADIQRLNQHVLRDHATRAGGVEDGLRADAEARAAAATWIEQQAALNRTADRTHTPLTGAPRTSARTAPGLPVE
jgi:1-deoxy-D-xylulose-5-phosphate reductoisomerase